MFGGAAGEPWRAKLGGVTLCSRRFIQLLQLRPTVPVFILEKNHPNEETIDYNMMTVRTVHVVRRVVSVADGMTQMCGWLLISSFKCCIIWALMNSFNG